MIAAPEEFKKYRQFILWQLVNGVKKPVSPYTLQTVDPHDPAHWLDYTTAAAVAEQCKFGLGFVFTSNDPLFFIDIDKSWDGRQWSQVATQLCEVFKGCAVEISQSNTGLHIFGSGQLPPHGCKNTKLGLELYTESRFVALTGTGLTGDAGAQPRQDILNWLVQSYFPVTEPVSSCEWTDGPCPEWNGPVDDAELLKKAWRTKSGASLFGGKASFEDLWHENVDVLCEAYPPQSYTNPYDHSSADAALCAHLAFWTGKDADRMDRLFRESALYREKWERQDYRYSTVTKAIGNCKTVYGSKNGKTHEMADTLRQGFQYMQPSEQMEYFKDFVYIRDLHRIITPDGALLKHDQFKSMYGGHVFALDSTNNKTTRNAWEAFTESQAVNFPKAFGACFRPECKPLEIIEEEGGTLVNTYVPIETKRTKGDAAPFINHIKKLLPEKRDRQILLAYAAAAVQYPGYKFQWTPLIQGVEGNGKTFIANCIANAIGWKYVHIPNARDITNTFNSWILGKLFIQVEEIYVRDKQEAHEVLKPLITNPKIEIHGKNVNQITGDNRANFFMCTNHKDAIRKTLKDRRYCVFYTAQQSLYDLHASGMDGDYFPKLYGWAKKNGYAIVTDFLLNYPIPDEFNPAKNCHRAPETSSTNEVLRVSMGGLEQEILDAVDEGRYGFAGGWISSKQFNQLLKERRDEKRIPVNKRKQILEDLGYIQHPGLKGGRVNNMIPKEAGKPILYIKKDHPAMGIVGAAEIAKIYQSDQEEYS